MKTWLYVLSVISIIRSQVQYAHCDYFFFSSRRRHTRFDCDWSSDVCSSDLASGYRVVYTASTPSTSEIFLYDSASSTPQQLVSLSTGIPPDPRFISAQKIAYVDNPSSGPTRIMSLELGTRAKSTEVTVNGSVPAFAYSHDGSLLAYLLHDTSGTGKASLHMRRGGQETTLNLNTFPGRGVGRD